MNVLEVERANEEVGEQAREQERSRGRRSRECPNRKDAKRHQRVGEPRLEEDEGRQQREGRAAEAERVNRGPAVIGRGDDRVHAQHQGRRDEDGSRDVDALAEADALVLVDEPRTKSHGRDADGQVDEEDPVPADPLSEESTREQTQRTATGDDEREDAHGLGALRRLAELGDDDGDDHAGGQRAAQALQEAADDEVVGPIGEPAAHRCNREEEDSRQEDLAASDQVTEPPGHEQEAPVGDQVAVDHPGQAGLGKTKVSLHVRQRHVHDRGVEHDHELPEADHDQGQPPSEIRVHNRLQTTEPM